MSAPKAQLLQQLQQLRSKVFQSIAPSGSNARIGTKYLRKPLKGPHVLSYYPPLLPYKLFSASLFKKETSPFFGLKTMQPDGTAIPKLVHESELHRLKKVAKQKRVGKAPPKKGLGRRSQTKKR